MTKYATLRKYQPYIDIVMADLGLTDKVELEWKFARWNSMGGDSILYSVVFENGKRFGTVRVSHEAEHNSILQTIMHELKHIQQYYLDKLKPAYQKSYKTNRGNLKWKWIAVWMDKEYDFFGCSRNAKLNQKYKSQPWEVEAYSYQTEVARLFPNNKLPERKLIGVVGKTKFYKTRA